MQTYACDVLFRPDEDLAFLPEGPIDCGQGRFSWVAIQHGRDSNAGCLFLGETPFSSLSQAPLYPLEEDH